MSQLWLRKNAAVAHCPCSNFFLKSGVFPYARFSKQGLKIGFGSDIAAGPQMSLFEVMKDAAYMQNDFWFSPAELLYRATLGGVKRWLRIIKSAILQLERKLTSLLLTH